MLRASWVCTSARHCSAALLTKALAEVRKKALLMLEKEIITFVQSVFTHMTGCHIGVLKQ